MFLKLGGITNHGEDDKQCTNNIVAEQLLSKQENRIPKLIFDLYSKNNMRLPGNNFSKTYEAIRNIDYNIQKNEEQNSINSTSKHNDRNFMNTRELFSSANAPSDNQTTADFKDYCMKLMDENRGKNKETNKNEEKNKGLRSKNNGTNRYKTELCRPFEENGSCKYAEKCQFAHGRHELRTLIRHPKYKTDLCKTYHTTGLCPYGLRCHFIHNNQERKISQANRLIMELAEKTFMVKHQSSLLNHKFIASLLNSQQPKLESLSLEQVSQSLNMQPPNYLQQINQINIFKRALDSSDSSGLQQPNGHRQQQKALMFSRSMDSSSPSASSSLNESPTTSPTNLPNHLSIQSLTHLPSNLPSHLSTSYPPHVVYREERKSNDLFQEDLLSAKLKSIMQSARLFNA